MIKSSHVLFAVRLLYILLILSLRGVAQDAPEMIAPVGYLDSLWYACERVVQDGSTVSIIHLGDSHIQAGHYTVPIRRLFHQIGGGAGIGWLGAYRLLGTNPPIYTAVRASSGGTSGVKITQRQYDYESPTGMLLRTNANRSITYTLQCSDGQSFDRIVIYRHRGTQPFSLADQTAIQLSHDTLTMQQIVTDTLQLSHYVSSAKVIAPSSSIWYGASLERSDGGCLVHTIGYNGATYYTYSKGTFGSSVSALAPQLMIVSLGTNESLARQFDRNQFGEQVARVVQRLQESNPNCPIILTSPLYCYRKVRTRRRGKRKSYRTTYQSNPNCHMIAQELRKQANKLGCGYIDLFGYFGGDEGAPRLLSEGILSQDHVHLTATGYHKLGQALANALDKDYKLWQKAHTPHPLPSLLSVYQP